MSFTDKSLTNVIVNSLGAGTPCSDFKHSPFIVKNNETWSYSERVPFSVGKVVNLTTRTRASITRQRQEATFLSSRTHLIRLVFGKRGNERPDTWEVWGSAASDGVRGGIYGHNYCHFEYP